MKKVVKLINLFILLLIINCGVVRAANACGNVTISSGSKVLDEKNIHYFGGFPIYKYTFNINSSTNVTAVTAYCHNPGINDYTDSNANNGNGTSPINMGCTSLLFDETGNTPTDNIFGVGLMTILNGNVSYNVKYIAENMYEMLFPLKNSKSYSTKQVENLKYYINSIYKGGYKDIYGDFKNDLKKLTNYIGKYNVISGTFSSELKCESDCATPDEIKGAITLLKKGIKAAILYARGDVKNPDTKINTPTHVRTTRTNNGKTENVNTLTYTINMDNFPTYDEKSSNNPSVNLSFTFNNKVDGVSTNIYLNDEKVSDLEKINILKYTTNGKGKVTLKIEIISDSKNCSDVKYTLKSSYNYNTSFTVDDDDDLSVEDRALIEEVLKALSNTGYEVGECSSREKCQGFYVLQNNSNGNGNNNNNNGSGSGNNYGVDVGGQNDISKTASVSDTINLCKSTGTPSSGKDICPARISNVSCAECEPNNHTIDIKEGYTYSDNNTCNTTGESLNVNDCIIDNKDTVGNDYKSTELSNISNKGGANVYCKEDYTLKLPGSKVTEPGTYFTLDPTSISGTKYCYSSRYNSAQEKATEITSAAESQITIYNEYSYYKALKDCANGVEGACTYEPGTAADSNGIKGVIRVETCTIPGNTTKTVEKSSAYDCAKTCKGTCGGIGGRTCSETISTTEPGVRYTYGGKLIINYTNYETCGVPISKSEEYDIEITSDRDCHSKNQGTMVEQDLSKLFNESLKKFLNEKIGTKSTLTFTPVGDQSKGPRLKVSGVAGTGLTGDLEVGEGAFANAIAEWNNSFDWKMDYNFNPVVRFWYQEDYMKNILTDKMEKTNTKSASPIEQLYCDGEVTDDYKCIDSVTKKVKDWSKTLDTITISACTCDPDSGCKISSGTLYNAKYVKQEQTKSASYQVPKQFYSIHPSGSITIGKPGQSDKIDNATGLANVLPVSLNTIGTRRYVIWAENLGEYYSKNNNGELGRIWGFKNSVLPALLTANEKSKCTTKSALVNEDNTQGVIHSNGVYACKYTTNCPTSSPDDTCKKPDESSDGNWHCQNGETCTEEQYNNECSNTCKKPDESSDGNWHCKNGEKCTEEQYYNECSNTCKKPDESSDGNWHCQNGEKCTEEQYNNECSNACKKPDESSDGNWHCQNGETCTENRYKVECCPDCPPSTKYSCAVPYEETINGEVKYSYNNKLRVSAEEFAQDCGCRETTAENGKTVYYGKNGKQTDEKTYKTQCCPDGDCPVTCSFCLYDGNKLNIQYRPITSEDLNPNNRELGNNWKVDEPIDTTMELKAYVTTKEIEEDGDKIFDTSNDKKNNNFVMKVTMDPSMISEIRKMNNSDGFNKGFVANTLKCYDYKKDDVVYENIYCYSTFIDELIKTFGTGNNKPINFTTNRPLTDGERKNSDNNEKYFTSLATTNLLSESNKSKWNITTTTGLEGNYNKYGLVLDENGNITDYHVGPSWK